MKLPDHVDGFVDLKTLKDIHHYLAESTREDDLTLTDWIKKHYLHESITSERRLINTTEGFLHLHNAYKRVRSLTNKAQDKWPFFDRNWKSMTAKTVRKNGQGKPAPGVTDNDSSIPPAKHGEARATMATPPSEDLQDAGNGRIRAKSSEFMPKSSPKAKTTKEASPAPLTPISPQPASEPAVELEWFGPPLLLAAHAPSVWSSLDRLPPGCSKKRKRSSGGEGQRKRSPVVKMDGEEVEGVKTRSPGRAKKEEVRR
jgi:hypothetical protein